MGIRLAAALLLAVQLTQLAAPALCAPSQRSVACHETSPSGVPQLVAPVPAHQMPCAQSAMCTVPAAGLPETVVLLGAPTVGRIATPAARTLQPGDQPPPLSPPPQA